MTDTPAKKKLPVVGGTPDPAGTAKAGKAKAAKAERAKAGGWAAFTDGGTAPRWVTGARIVLVLAFAATIPTILGLEHGNRLLWTVAIAALPFFWMAFGYHLWRRMCPLAVMGQLGRLVGRPGTRKMGEWMGKHYLLVQLGLLVVALSLRLIATNGSDVWLAGFLGVVVIAAIATSFIYGGKTWCNFLCPVGLVEKLYTEPARGAAAPELTLAVRAVRRVQEALPRHRSRAGLLEGGDRPAAPDRVLRLARDRRGVLYLLLSRLRRLGVLLLRRLGVRARPPRPAARAGVHVRARDPTARRRAADPDRVRAGQLRPVRDAREGRDRDPRQAAGAGPDRRGHGAAHRPDPPRHARAVRADRVQRVLLLRRPADAGEAAAVGRHRLGHHRRVRLDRDLRPPDHAARGPARPREVRAEDPQEVGVGRRAALR